MSSNLIRIDMYISLEIENIQIVYMKILRKLNKLTKCEEKYWREDQNL